MNKYLILSLLALTGCATIIGQCPNPPIVNISELGNFMDGCPDYCKNVKYQFPKCLQWCQAASYYTIEMVNAGTNGEFNSNP